MAARRPTGGGRSARALLPGVCVALLSLAAHPETWQGAAENRLADRVVLISIDGLRPDAYLPAASRRVRTPALDALRDRGSWAEGVVGQYPSLTYPSHTSIATGMRPARHGIVQNTKFDPVTGGSAGWYFEAAALTAPAIWDIAGAAGLKTAAVSWPVTVGARIDYLFPETNQAPRDSTWLDLARRQSTPGLIDAIVTRLGGFGPNDNRDYKQRDRFAAAAASYIIERYRPNLLLVHLVEADTAQHSSGPNSPDAIAAFERVDARVGEIVEAVKSAGIADRTTFIITGDHGFYRVHSAFQPNVVLRDAGLIELDANGQVRTWQAIAHRSAIRLRDPGDSALARRVEQLFSELVERRYAGLLRIVGREEIARLGGDPAALLFLEPVEGYTTSGGFEGQFLVASTRRGDHGYLPTVPAMHTGLIVAGAGVRPGLALPVARQIDIAPTVARLLGLEMTDTDGMPMSGLLLMPAARRSPPVAVTDSLAKPGSVGAAR